MSKKERVLNNKDYDELLTIYNNLEKWLNKNSEDLPMPDRFNSPFIKAKDHVYFYIDYMLRKKLNSEVVNSEEFPNILRKILSEYDAEISPLGKTLGSLE